MRQNRPQANFSALLKKVKAKPIDRELGFGKNATTDGRMMNADGSFNVERQPLNWVDNVHYHLNVMPWSHFLALIFLLFVGVNLLFSLCYVSIGIEHFNGVTPGNFTHNFMQAFFFSSQTLTTVGYGHISPNGLTVSILAAFESFMGLLVFAIMTGLLYGRFARPSARVLFSENILVAPYKSGFGLMFRMGNASKSELIETEVQVTMALNQREDNGSLARKFYALTLEINKINFFSYSWTIVHAIDDNSPLNGLTYQDLLDANIEVIVLVKGIDETSQQLVHARRSYAGVDLVWNARFLPIIEKRDNGMLKVLVPKVGTHELLDEKS